MAWQLLAGAARAALPAIGRTLMSKGVKGEVSRAAVGSALSKRQQSSDSSGSSRPAPSGEANIGQNPGQNWYQIGN